MMREQTHPVVILAATIHQPPRVVTLANAVTVDFGGSCTMLHAESDEWTDEQIIDYWRQIAVNVERALVARQANAT